MVKNNIELDVKVKCIENGTTQAKIAEDSGNTLHRVVRVTGKKQKYTVSECIEPQKKERCDIDLPQYLE